MSDATINQAGTATGEAGFGDYFALLKPRVMSLVVFTALVGLAAAPVAVHPMVAFASILFIAVGGGASGALNMWWDADIDRVMKRTARRPVPSGKVTAENALAVGLTLSVMSVVMLWLAAGAVAAGLLAFTIFFYVVVYSVWLKRITPQNIVIGGAAGALPPVIGWAAVTGDLTLAPILLFALVFYWTPPHFWALALRIGSDYAAAGVPMLPVTAGPAETARQIWLYTILLVAMSLMLWAVAGMGLVYLAVAVIGGGIFLLRAWRLRSDVLGDGLLRGATRLYRFSISYLTLIFAAIAIDSILPR